MRHPILYRLAMYSIIIGLCGSILILVDHLAGVPFKSSDMRDAYLYGCELGSKPLDPLKVTKCVWSADTFKVTLDDLDVQIEKLNEQSK